MGVWRHVAALSLLVVVGACSQDDAPTNAGDDEIGARGTAAKLRALGAKPCEGDAEFLCLPLSVPLDHARPEGKKITVTFAVRPAPARTRKGVLLSATGGPGYSGIAGMDSYRTTDERIPDRFDVVWFDLRGVGLSGALECKNATKKFYEGGLRSESDATDRALVAKSKTYANDCVRELGIPKEDLPFYETRQSIEDIETFRKVLGDDKLSLYGLSYGTQLMQTYAAAHPEHVRALVIDGVIDLTLDHVAYMKNLNHGIETILDKTIAHCASEPACASAFSSAPGATPKGRIFAAYDALATKLASAPSTLAYRKSNGSIEQRRFTRGDLDTTTFNAAGAPETRRGFLNALVAAQRGDLMPFLLLSYEASGIEPETAGPNGTAAADPDMSNAIYYTTTCNDYGNDAATENERALQYLAGGIDLRRNGARVLSPYYGDLPCAFWPVTRKAAPIAPLRGEGFPVIVLGATGDGATPFDQGEAVARRLADGYAITVDGGKHVMYGRGNECADKPITELLVEGTKPASRTIRCEDEFVGRP